MRNFNQQQNNQAEIQLIGTGFNTNKIFTQDLKQANYKPQSQSCLLIGYMIKYQYIIVMKKGTNLFITYDKIRIIVKMFSIPRCIRDEHLKSQNNENKKLIRVPAPSPEGAGAN